VKAFQRTFRVKMDAKKSVGIALGTMTFGGKGVDKKKR